MKVRLYCFSPAAGIDTKKGNSVPLAGSGSRRTRTDKLLQAADFLTTPYYYGPLGCSLDFIFAMHFCLGGCRQVSTRSNPILLSHSLYRKSIGLASLGIVPVGVSPNLTPFNRKFPIQSLKFPSLLSLPNFSSEPESEWWAPLPRPLRPKRSALLTELHPDI